MKRTVHLLEPDLTPRQRAQKKYQASAKGRAAALRALRRLRAKERADAALMAKKRAAIASWLERNKGHRLGNLLNALA